MPYNIPNEPGVVLVPGNIETFCEWLVSLNGRIATCVESAEMMVDHLVKAGFPVSAAEDTALAQDLINRGQASPDGATTYWDASQQMTRLGIPNTAYGADWFNAHPSWAQTIQAAIQRGVPVLFGVYAAHALFDDWTQTHMDGGVNGHAITIVGYDASGAIVADPNTAQAQRGEFVHYSWANLASAFGGYPSMVIPEGALRVAVQPVWNAAAGTLAFPAHDGIPAIQLDHGQAFYAHMSRVGLYPLHAATYLPDGDSVVYWNDGQRSRAVKANNWSIVVEDAGPMLAAAMAEADTVTTFSQQVASLQAQLAAAQAQAQAQAPSPADANAVAAIQALATALVPALATLTKAAALSVSPTAKGF